MKIRPVRMRMHQVLMVVAVRMSRRRRKLRVLVGMMAVVVPVAVDVLDRPVPMVVSVFPGDQCTNRHDQRCSRQHLNGRDWITEDH